jgi:hypothetical protein
MSEEVRAAVRQDGCGWLRVWADLPLLGQWDRTKSVAGRTWLRRCCRPRGARVSARGGGAIGWHGNQPGRVVDPASGMDATGDVAVLDGRSPPLGQGWAAPRGYRRDRAGGSTRLHRPARARPINPSRPHPERPLSRAQRQRSDLRAWKLPMASGDANWCQAVSGQCP